MNKLLRVISFIGLLILTQCENTKSRRLPYYKDPFFTPHWIEKGDERLKDFHTISPFQLINQNGDSISNLTFMNKIYVADFFFTRCPGICPKMTENMSKIQDSFIEDNDILLLSHSVTPELDSIAILQEYAKEKGVIDGKWHLATGDRDQIYSLGRNDYFVEEDLGIKKTADDFIHTENFVLIDGRGHIRGIYNGLNTGSVQQLIEDILLLKEEKRAKLKED